MTRQFDRPGHILDVGEVAALAAVAVDDHRRGRFDLATERLQDAVGALAWTPDGEEPQGEEAQSVETGEESAPLLTVDFGQRFGMRGSGIEIVNWKNRSTVHLMKVTRMLVVVGLLCLPSVRAQVDFPGNPTVTPKKTATRSIGGGVNPGASIDSATTSNPNVRYVTHMVLCEYRMWTNTEGKPLEAKLLAFEDLVAETPKGAAEPVMPEPPAHPTVTRNGKIRLLVNKKAVEVALDKLSQSDREFIDQMKAALEKKAAAGK